MSLFRMTEAEYDRLNSPAKLGEVINDDRWLYIGHIPKPKTRLGWFVYNVIHGMAMRYRFIPVIVFSVAEMFRKDIDETVNVVLPDEDELQCHYDDKSDTLYIRLYGSRSNVVERVNDQVALLRDEESDLIVGVVAERYMQGNTRR